MSNNKKIDSHTIEKNKPFHQTHRQWGMINQWFYQHRRLIEIVIVFIVSAAIGAAFAIIGRGGPNSSDITLYMNLGMNGIRMPFVLNRYFNIFMQQIFIEIAASPIEGYHYYWGFLMGMTTFLIYVSARKALPSSNVFHGILAVLIFYSTSVLAGLSGVVVVDFPAMVVMAAIFTVYIISVNQGHSNPWLIGAMGALFFLAFKTKETTMPIAILFIGLGWIDQNPFKLKYLLSNFRWIIIGVIAGVVIFAVLSSIFLGDPFFGLRISDWQEYYITNDVYASNVFATLNALDDGVLDDWYQGYWFEITLLPFLLFIISGITKGRYAIEQRKLLWLAPLVFIVFLIVSVNNQFGFESRFGLPILPIISVLASQFIELEIPEKNEQKWKFWLLFILGLVIIFGIRVLLRMIIPSLNYDLGSVVLLVYYPVLLTLLFFSIFFFINNSYWHLINFMIVISLLLAPIASNFRAMFIVRENHNEFMKVVLPFSEFQDFVTFSPDMRFYTSDQVFHTSRIRMVKNIDELLVLFNIFFDTSATRENFVFVENPQYIAEDILADSLDYVMLTSDEWEKVQQEESKSGEINDNFQVIYGYDHRIVLLVSQ